MQRNGRRSVRKLAVVRANGIGDFVFSLPALDALRATYPDAEIVLLGKAWHAAFLDGRPGPVDRVVVVPTYGGVSAEPGVEEDAQVLDDFFAAMRDEHFDVAVQMHGGGRYSNPFTRRLGASYAIGLRAPDAEALDRCMPFVYWQPEVTRYLELVALVGADPVTLEPRLELKPEDRAELAPLDLPERNLLAVHPGASDPKRRWPAERFGLVAKTLGLHGAQAVVLGDANDRELAARVVAASDGKVRDLSGVLSLGGVAAILARSRLVIANDSGPLHLAEALGAATVGIYWCGNLLNGAPFTRTRHRPLASWRLECPVCAQNTLIAPCSHLPSFVADVPLEQVCEAALGLWESSASA